MSERWDAIVIGAGIGGLTAAALLVKAGMRVLVVDRNSHPGGTAYVYQRQGLTFPMGPLGFTNPSLVQEAFGVLDRGNIKLFKIQYRIKAFGLDLPLSLPFPKMVDELIRLFPEEEGAIKTFFSDVEKTAITMNIPEHAPNHFVLEQAMSQSASEYLSGRVKDWKLRRILGSIGTQEPYSSLPLLSAMWNLLCKEGIWYPEGGMRLFCDRMAQAVTGYRRQKGGFGKIRLGTEVKEIRIERGNVSGVTLAEGAQIDSNNVISNADYKNTFLRLIPSKAIPDEWFQAVAKAKQTRSNLQVCLGVDANRVDLSSFKETDRLIYRRGTKDVLEEIDWNANEIDPESLARQELEVSLLSRNDRTLGPEGTEILVIRTEAEHFHFSRFRPKWKKRVPEYRGYKMRLGRALIREVESLIPGLEKSILVTDVATPLTFEEQGGRSGGAVAGWSWNYDDRSDFRSQELVRTPIQGLYMAGYQAFSTLFMGGIPTAMESGKRAAHAVLQDAGPIENIMIPVP